MTEVQITAELLADEIHQMAFEEGKPAENGDGYLFTAEEFDLFVDRLLTRNSAALTAHIRSLTERLEKAEQDAWRYRWLRKSDGAEGDFERSYLVQECSDVHLDIAIDAAIAQEADHE